MQTAKSSTTTMEEHYSPSTSASTPSRPRSNKEFVEFFEKKTAEKENQKNHKTTTTAAVVTTSTSPSKQPKLNNVSSSNKNNNSSPSRAAIASSYVKQKIEMFEKLITHEEAVEVQMQNIELRSLLQEKEEQIEHLQKLLADSSPHIAFEEAKRQKAKNHLRGDQLLISSFSSSSSSPFSSPKLTRNDVIARNNDMKMMTMSGYEINDDENDGGDDDDDDDELKNEVKEEIEYRQKKIEFLQLKAKSFRSKQLKTHSLLSKLTSPLPSSPLRINNEVDHRPRHRRRSSLIEYAATSSSTSIDDDTTNHIIIGENNNNQHNHHHHNQHGNDDDDDDQRIKMLKKAENEITNILLVTEKQLHLEMKQQNHLQKLISSSPSLSSLLSPSTSASSSSADRMMHRSPKSPMTPNMQRAVVMTSPHVDIHPLNRSPTSMRRLLNPKKDNLLSSPSSSSSSPKVSGSDVESQLHHLISQSSSSSSSSSFPTFTSRDLHFSDKINVENNDDDDDEDSNYHSSLNDDNDNDDDDCCLSSSFSSLSSSVDNKYDQSNNNDNNNNNDDDDDFYNRSDDEMEENENNNDDDDLRSSSSIEWSTDENVSDMSAEFNAETENNALIFNIMPLISQPSSSSLHPPHRQTINPRHGDVNIDGGDDDDGGDDVILVNEGEELKRAKMEIEEYRSQLYEALHLVAQSELEINKLQKKIATKETKITILQNKISGQKFDTKQKKIKRETKKLRKHIKQIQKQTEKTNTEITNLRKQIRSSISSLSLKFSQKYPSADVITVLRKSLRCDEFINVTSPPHHHNYHHNNNMINDNNDEDSDDDYDYENDEDDEGADDGDNTLIGMIEDDGKFENNEASNTTSRPNNCIVRSVIDVAELCALTESKDESCQNNSEGKNDCNAENEPKIEENNNQKRKQSSSSGKRKRTKRKNKNEKVCNNTENMSNVATNPVILEQKLKAMKSITHQNSPLRSPLTDISKTLSNTPPKKLLAFSVKRKLPHAAHGGTKKKLKFADQHSTKKSHFPFNIFKSSNK